MADTVPANTNLRCPTLASTSVRSCALAKSSLAILTVVTLFWPRWIESLTGLEPDAGSGDAEWGIVILFAVLALAAGLLARRDYRLAKLRSRAASSSAA
jgi:hypothetical protein